MEHDEPHFKPLLVIVSGSPASGKTTLARRLAAELRLPLVARDELKEVLYDTLGAPDRATSQALGKASAFLLYHVAARLLGAEVGAVVESNFRRGQAEVELAALAGKARTVLVHCGGDPEIVVHRYRERAERGERHAGHHDLAVAPRLEAELAGDVYTPLDLPVPVLRVDTTQRTPDGYAPAFDEIVAFVRRAG